MAQPGRYQRRGILTPASRQALACRLSRWDCGAALTRGDELESGIGGGCCFGWLVHGRIVSAGAKRRILHRILRRKDWRRSGQHAARRGLLSQVHERHFRKARAAAASEEIRLELRAWYGARTRDVAWALRGSEG